MLHFNFIIRRIATVSMYLLRTTVILYLIQRRWRNVEVLLVFFHVVVTYSLDPHVP